MNFVRSVLLPFAGFSWLRICRYWIGVLGLLLCALPAWTAPSSRSLPEFADLVTAQGAAVVNISAAQTARGPRNREPLFEEDKEPDDKKVPDFLYRFIVPPPEPQESEPRDQEFEDRSLGSGFVISPDGYILTNAHVVAEAEEITVRFADKRELPARLIGTDKRTDVALLKVEATALQTIKLGDPSRLRVGDWVLAIGSPFGFDSTVTAGIVSAKDRALPDESIVPFIQTDVAINPGNSGGPLFNLKGEVVAMNSQIYSRTGGFMGLSFSIPIDVAMDVQAQLKQRGRVLRGKIGVLIQELTRDMADGFGLKNVQGALVSNLEEGGPAQRAGVVVGDIIQRFDGRPVADSNALPRIVGATQPGRVVRMQIWRQGAIHELQVVVSQFPEDTLAHVAPAAPAILPSKNRLGLQTRALNAAQAKKLGQAYGLVVESSSGIAARADLRRDDVLLTLTTQGKSVPLQSVAQFEKLCMELSSGHAVVLRVRRGDTQSFVSLKVAGR